MVCKQIIKFLFSKKVNNLFTKLCEALYEGVRLDNVPRSNRFREFAIGNLPNRSCGVANCSDGEGQLTHKVLPYCPTLKSPSIMIRTLYI